MAEINYYAGINMIPNGNDILMNQNELQEPVMDNESTPPSSPVQGQMYFDTTAGDKTMYFYNGTAWIEMDGSGSGVATIVGGDGIDATVAGTEVTLDSTASLSTSPGSFVDFTGSTLTATTGAIAITGDLSATGTPSGTNFLRGDNVWATPAGSYTSWSLEGDTGAAVDITDGLRVDFTGGTGISTEVSTATPNLLTITNTGVTSVIAGNNISVSAATGAVTIAGTANTTSLGIANSGGTEQFTVTDTVDLQFAAAGGASVAFDNTNKRVTYTAPSNTNTEYNLLTTNGSNPDLVLDPTTGTDAIVNVNGTSTTVKVTGVLTNELEFDLVDDVTIAASLSVTTDLTVGDDIALTGGTSKITGLVTNQITNDTDAANKKYVDDLVAGGLTFKDGFNAGTGVIDGGGNLTTGGSRVAVSIGDYYVVTTAGSFYGSVALDVGDSVIARLDAAAGTSDVNDWVIIQGDEGVVSIGLATGTSTGAPLTANATSGAITLTSKSYAGASNAGYVPVGGSGSTFLRGDGTWVTPTNSGGTITSIDITETGDALTITETGTATDPNFNIAGAGASTQYINGELNLVTFPDIPAYTAGTGLTLNTLEFDVNVDGTNSVAANNSSSTASRTYKVQVDSGDNLVVNVPWADTNTQNVTSVAASTTNDELGIVVSPTTGAVKVGLDIIGQTNLASAPATDDELIIYDTSAATNKAVTIANLASAVQGNNGYAETITAWGGTITHSLGSFDVTVQLYDDTSKETIYAEIDRTGTNTIVVNGNGTFPSTNVRVLVSKVS